MKARFLVLVLLLGLLGLVGCDLEKIGDLISATPKLNVANESANPDGDIVTPNHSVGFSGSGAGQKGAFRRKSEAHEDFRKVCGVRPECRHVVPRLIGSGQELARWSTKPNRNRKNSSYNHRH
jgi:hypothetical protein